MPSFSLPTIGGWLAVASLALAPSCVDAMDLNRASQAELQSLRGIGARTAALIVQERTRGGPYESLENLAERVRGIGHKKAASLARAGLRAGRPELAEHIRMPSAPSVGPGVIIEPTPSSAQTIPSASAPGHHATRPRRPMVTP